MRVNDFKEYDLSKYLLGAVWPIDALLSCEVSLLATPLASRIPNNSQQSNTSGIYGCTYCQVCSCLDDYSSRVRRLFLFFMWCFCRFWQRISINIGCIAGSVVLRIFLEPLGKKRCKKSGDFFWLSGLHVLFFIWPQELDLIWSRPGSRYHCPQILVKLTGGRAEFTIYLLVWTCDSENLTVDTTQQGTDYLRSFSLQNSISLNPRTSEFPERKVLELKGIYLKLCGTKVIVQNWIDVLSICVTDLQMEKAFTVKLSKGASMALSKRWPMSIAPRKGLTCILVVK